MYKLVYQRVDLARLAGDTGPNSDKIPLIDNKWIELTTFKSITQLDAYLADFKRQKEDAVKVFFK